MNHAMLQSLNQLAEAYPTAEFEIDTWPGDDLLAELGPPTTFGPALVTIHAEGSPAAIIKRDGSVRVFSGDEVELGGAFEQFTREAWADAYVA